MQVTAADLSVKHSSVDGIQQYLAGVWDDVLNCMVAGKARKPPEKPPPPKRMSREIADDDKLDADDDASGPEDDVPVFSMEEEASTLAVGDSVRVKPFMCDEFQNPVGVKNQMLELVVTGPQGEERIPIVSQLIRGVYTYDVQYELRHRGRYKLDIVVDEVPISGCPIEWSVKMHRLG